MSLLYSLAVNICWIYAKFFFKTVITGLENIPPVNTGYILTANHLSYFDPFIIARFIPENVHFIAMDELMRNPITRILIKCWGCIPIKRNAADRQAIKKALGFLENRKVVGVFPEGSINKKENITQYQAGVALLCLNSGKPVLPVYIEGTRNLYSPFGFTRKKIFISYKPVLDFKNVNFNTNSNKVIREKLLKLIEEHLKYPVTE